eukprot:3156135-Rhodomonas_salina.1
MAYAASCLRACYVMSGTIILRSCYSMSGTNISYHATRPAAIVRDNAQVQMSSGLRRSSVKPGTDVACCGTNGYLPMPVLRDARD